MALTLWPDRLGLRSQAGQPREAPEGRVEGPSPTTPNPDPLGVSDRTGATTLSLPDLDQLGLYLELRDIMEDRAAAVRIWSQHVLAGWVEDPHEIIYYKRKIFVAARQWGMVNEVLQAASS